MSLFWTIGFVSWENSTAAKETNKQTNKPEENLLVTMGAHIAYFLHSTLNHLESRILM